MWVGASLAILAGFVLLGPPRASTSQPSTTTVRRGTVLESVSATGNVTADTELGLSFSSGGRLVELNVKEGDRATLGQVLARVDDRDARSRLDAGRAALASARAQLALTRLGATPQERALNQTSIEKAQLQLGQAEAGVEDARATAEKKAVSYQAAIDQALAGVEDARATAKENAVRYEEAIDQAEAGVDAARATAKENAVRYEEAIDQAEAGVTQARATADQNAIGYQTAVDQAEAALDEARQTLADAEDAVAQAQAEHDAAKAKDPPDPQAEQQARAKLDAALSQRANAESQLRSAHEALTNAKNAQRAGLLADQQAIRRAQDAVTDAKNARGAGLLADQQAIRKAQAVVTDAKNAQKAGLLADQQAIRKAQAVVTDAKNAQEAGLLADQQTIREAQDAVGSANAALKSALAEVAVKEAPPSAADVAADQARVASAQADVDSARKALDDTVLVAPANGTVVSIANEVGELVSGGGGDLRGLAASTQSSAPPPTSGFIVLTDLGSLLVKAGFNEVDAAKLKPGQAATVAFEALPEAASGRVVATDTSSTLVNNVVTYNVTVLLTQPVEGVKLGMTASVEVIVNEKTSVLKVPSSAVSTRGGVSTVTILEGNRQVRRPVKIGLRGDDATEVTGGLGAGDKVVTGQGGTPAGPSSGGGEPGGRGGRGGDGP